MTMHKCFNSNQHVASQKKYSGEALPGSAVKMESALSYVNFSKHALRGSTNAGVSLAEQAVSGLLLLRANNDKSKLNTALLSVLELALPGTLGSNTSAGSDHNASLCIRWMSPDEWLLSCPLANAYSIESQLREALQSASYAIVNVSGGFTVLRLRGPHALNVLKKSVTYDVHPEHFSVGKVVNTVFAKAQVTMMCCGHEDYELIVRRSFADYVWTWLQVASREYGLDLICDN